MAQPEAPSRRFPDGENSSILIFYRDVGAFSKVRPRLLQLRFGVFAPKSVHTKTSKFHGRFDLDEACAQFSWQRHCVRSCPMGWLGGINRRGEWAKRLCSLPSADRACWKIFSRSAGWLSSTTRSDEKSELEKIENH